MISLRPSIAKTTISTQPSIPTVQRTFNEKASEIRRFWHFYTIHDQKLFEITDNLSRYPVEIASTKETYAKEIAIKTELPKFAYKYRQIINGNRNFLLTEQLNARLLTTNRKSTDGIEPLDHFVQTQNQKKIMRRGILTIISFETNLNPLHNNKKLTSTNCEKENLYYTPLPPLVSSQEEYWYYQQQKQKSWNFSASRKETENQNTRENFGSNSTTNWT